MASLWEKWEEWACCEPARDVPLMRGIAGDEPAAERPTPGRDMQSVAEVKPAAERRTRFERCMTVRELIEADEEHQVRRSTSPCAVLTSLPCLRHEAREAANTLMYV